MAATSSIPTEDIKAKVSEWEENGIGRDEREGERAASSRRSSSHMHARIAPAAAFLVAPSC
jgi:hypothetical protein